LGWIVVVIVMWVLASLLLGVTMTLFLRRREAGAPPFGRGEPQLVRPGARPVSRVRAACGRRARRGRMPRAGA
jgi:hypothetical protein